MADGAGNSANNSGSDSIENNWYYLRRPLRGGTGELERIIAIEEKEKESSNASLRSKSASDSDSSQGEEYSSDEHNEDLYKNADSQQQDNNFI